MVIKDGVAQISVYGDNVASEAQIGTAVAKLVASYPQTFGRLNPQALRDFGLAIKDAIRKCGMSAQQLDDAVTDCIIHKPTFAISDICSFDRNVKLYPYSWASNKNGFVMSRLKWTNSQTGQWEYWWCRAQDLEQVNLIAKIKNQ